MNKTAIRKFAEWAREKLIEDIKYKVARSQILDTASRIDGRDLKTVRPIKQFDINI